MELESIEKCDLVHVQSNRRMGTVIEVRTKEPRYKIQFGSDAANVKSVKSDELALVQKYTPRENTPTLVLAASFAD